MSSRSHSARGTSQLQHSSNEAVADTTSSSRYPLEVLPSRDASLLRLVALSPFVLAVSLSPEARATMPRYADSEEEDDFVRPSPRPLSSAR